MDLARVGAGDVVAGRRLTTLLGTGGEGDVWRAERSNGAVVALKLIRPEVLPDPDEVRRRGAWLVRIDHPALVQVSRGGRFTAGPLEGWGFVEMDLVEGPSLQSVDPFPDALERLAGVGEALDLLHAGAWSDGIPLIHRDVKPGNLIASGDGLVLVDPSTMRGLDTRDLTRVGTPAYLAPEVMSGRFGPLVDVYSLAATATALMTGARGNVLLDIVSDPWRHDLPEGVCAGLEPEPSNRPGTCAAVLAADSGRAGRSTSDFRNDAPAPPGRPRQPIWGPVLLALVTLTPAVLWAVAQTQPSLVTPEIVRAGWFGAIGSHLAIHLLRRRALVGLFAPPWAWGDLIAGRPGNTGSRTAWLSDVVAGTILVAGIGVGFAARTTTPASVPGTVIVAMIVILLAQRAAGLSTRVGWGAAWLLTVPVRLLGTIPRVLITGTR